ADGGEFVSGAAFRNGSNGENIHDRMATRAFHDVAGDGGAVINRLGIGHARDGGESTGGGGARSGFDGFGMLKAGLAQVHVHVDEAGGNHHARCVEPFGIDSVQRGSNGGDASVFEQYISNGVMSGMGINDAAVLNKQLG